VTVTFPPGQTPRTPGFAIGREWLDHAELVVVNAVQARAFDRTLDIQAFPLSASGRQTSSAAADGVVPR
jgi:hypothetical protein